MRSIMARYTNSMTKITKATPSTVRAIMWLGWVLIFILIPILIPVLINLIVRISSEHTISIYGLFVKGAMVVLSLSLSSAAFIDYSLRDSSKKISMIEPFKNYFGILYGILFVLNFVTLILISLEELLGNDGIFQVRRPILFWISIVALLYSIVYSFFIKKALFKAEEL